MTKETMRRYIVSSLITFIVGVVTVLLAEIDNITLSSLKDGAIVGILVSALRAGVKGILELTLLTFNK